MGKQDPKNILKRAKTQGGKPETKDGGGVSGGAVGGELSDEMHHNHQALLPDIERGINGLNIFEDPDFDHPKFPYLSENDDPQRYQFEETTFAAPNILRELAEILHRFVILFKTYSQKATLYNPECRDLLPADSVTPSVLIPAGVKELLCQSWKDLTSDVVYAPRTWQSSPTRNAKKCSASTNEKTASRLMISSAPQKGTYISLEKEPVFVGGSKTIADLLQDARIKSRNKRDADISDTKLSIGYKKKKKELFHHSGTTASK